LDGHRIGVGIQILLDRRQTLEGQLTGEVVPLTGRVGRAIGERAPDLGCEPVVVVRPGAVRAGAAQPNPRGLAAVPHQAGPVIALRVERLDFV
jgi:hypothetical protein